MWFEKPIRAASFLLCNMLPVLLIILFPSSLLFARVSPVYERLNQFNAVMNAAIKEFAGRGLIDRIELMEDGTWRAWTKNCVVPITLTETFPQESLGGEINYKASVGEYRCN